MTSGELAILMSGVSGGQFWASSVSWSFGCRDRCKVIGSRAH